MFVVAKKDPIILGGWGGGGAIQSFLLTNNLSWITISDI